MAASSPKDVPAEIARGWNWGAFWLNWVWGLAHNTPLALLMFVPGVNLVMLFVLGAKGNVWAWQNNTWRDVEHFRRSQRIWARVGWGMAIGLPALFAVLMWSIVTMMTSSQPYQDSLAAIRSHPKLERSLGHPVEPVGWLVSGNIKYENDAGNASLSYAVAGPRGEGTVYLDANRQRGTWYFDSLVVVTADGMEILLIGTARSGGL